MSSPTPLTSRLLPCVLGLAVLAFGLTNILGLWPLSEGCDFTPIRHAARALISGRSVYSDPGFVYPPTAAVLAAPTALISQSVAYEAWTVASLGALGLAVVLIAAAVPRYKAAFAVLAGMLCFGGCVATDALGLGNASVLLVPVAVAAVLAFRRERWLLGCALVVGSMLFKPLLVPLLVVPALRRQWRPLIGCLLAGLALLLLTTALVGGDRSLLHVVLYCLRATNLHGALAWNNLSVDGYAEAHAWPSAVRLLVVSLLAVLTVGALCRLRGGDVVRTAALAFCATLLAGSISETHYLLTLGALTIIVLASDPTRRNAALLLPGLALLVLPVSVRDAVVQVSTAGRQSWYLLAEFLLWAGLAQPALRDERMPMFDDAAQLAQLARVPG